MRLYTGFDAGAHSEACFTVRAVVPARSTDFDVGRWALCLGNSVVVRIVGMMRPFSGTDIVCLSKHTQAITSISVRDIVNTRALCMVGRMP